MIGAFALQGTPLRSLGRHGRHGGCPALLFGPGRQRGRGVRRGWRPSHISSAAEKAPQQQAAASEAAGPNSQVTFTVSRHVAFGQQLKVVGSSPVLGSWDCAAAPAMIWGEGDVWSLTVDLPAGQHEFKLVVALQPAGHDWEGGSNRVVQVPDPLASANSGGAFSVVCEWGQTGVMLATPPQGSTIAASVDDIADLELSEASAGATSETEAEGPGSVATESSEGEAWVEDMCGEPTGALINDEGEPVVGIREVGKMTVGAGDEEKGRALASTELPDLAAATAAASAAAGEAVEAVEAAAVEQLAGAGDAAKSEEPAQAAASEQPVGVQEEPATSAEAAQAAASEEAAGVEEAAIPAGDTQAPAAERLAVGQPVALEEAKPAAEKAAEGTQEVGKMTVEGAEQLAAPAAEAEELASEGAATLAPEPAERAWERAANAAASRQGAVAEPLAAQPVPEAGAGVPVAAEEPPTPEQPEPEPLEPKAAAAAEAAQDETQAAPTTECVAEPQPEPAQEEQPVPAAAAQPKEPAAAAGEEPPQEVGKMTIGKMEIEGAERPATGPAPSAAEGAAEPAAQPEAQPALEAEVPPQPEEEAQPEAPPKEVGKMTVGKMAVEGTEGLAPTTAGAEGVAAAPEGGPERATEKAEAAAEAAIAGQPASPQPSVDAPAAEVEAPAAAAAEAPAAAPEAVAEEEPQAAEEQTVGKMTLTLGEMLEVRQGSEGAAQEAAVGQEPAAAPAPEPAAADAQGQQEVVMDRLPTSLGTLGEMQKQMTGAPGAAGPAEAPAAGEQAAEQPSAPKEAPEQEETVGKMTLGKMLEGGPAVLKGSEGQRAAQASAAAGAPAAPVQQPSGAAAEVLEPAKAPEQRPLQGKAASWARGPRVVSAPAGPSATSSAIQEQIRNLRAAALEGAALALAAAYKQALDEAREAADSEEEEEEELVVEDVVAATRDDGSDDEDDDKSQGGGSGPSGPAAGNGGKTSGGGRRWWDIFRGWGRPSLVEREVDSQVAEPSPGIQLAASVLGLLALPIVGWSEYQLKTTGCGLPPGPYGLLGAAEGISYLSVGGLVLWSLTRKVGSGRGLPAGPAGMLGAVEGGSWLMVATGLVVLVLQVYTYGYIPSALPDANCFGEPISAVPQGSGSAVAPPLQRTLSLLPAEVLAAQQTQQPQQRQQAQQALLVAGELGELGASMPRLQLASAGWPPAAAPTMGAGSPAEALTPAAAAGEGSLAALLPARRQLAAAGERLLGLASSAAGTVEQGLSALASPAAFAAEVVEEPPPLQKPMLEALEKVKSADPQPLVDALGRALGDLKEGFVGLAQNVIPGEEGEEQGQDRGAAAEAQAAGSANGAAAAAGEAVGAEGSDGSGEGGASGGRTRLGDSLREALDKADAHGKVLDTAREMGKRTSALIQRAGDAAEMLVRSGAPEDEEGEGGGAGALAGAPGAAAVGQESAAAVGAAGQ